MKCTANPPDSIKLVGDAKEVKSATTDESTASPTADPARTRKRTWVRFFRDVFLYLFVYVVIAGVSIGPMIWVWFGAVYVDGPKWVARFYQPLLVLCRLIPPLQWLIDAWIDWWVF